MKPTIPAFSEWFAPARSAAADKCRDTVAHPRRDWTVVSASFGILLLALIAFDAWMYFSSVGAGEASPPVAPSASPDLAAFTPQKLSDALSLYAALEREHEALRLAPPAVSDPMK